MSEIEQIQLNTLFGNLVVIEGICPKCGHKVYGGEVRPYFLNGLTVFCENCDNPIEASSLTQHALDGVPPQETGDLTPADVDEKMWRLRQSRRQ